MLLGVVIGLLVITVFLVPAHTQSDWGRFWMLRPLIVTPFAGAMGGLFFSIMENRYKSGWKRAVAIILSILVFIVGLWLGIVLGLAGTLWD